MYKATQEDETGRAAEPADQPIGNNIVVSQPTEDLAYAQHVREDEREIVEYWPER